jgi:hypothetical protein
VSIGHSIDWILIALSAWVAVAMVVGAIRYAYPPLLWGTVGWIAWVLRLATFLLADPLLPLMFEGVMWISFTVWLFPLVFKRSLDAKGIDLRRVLLFR